jgi:hypothetical protein
MQALRAWLAAAGLVEGPLFVELTPQSGLREAALEDRRVAHVVKRRCKAAGINPKLAGPSLRRGFATAAARAKKHRPRLGQRARCAAAPPKSPKGRALVPG